MCVLTQILETLAVISAILAPTLITQSETLVLTQRYETIVVHSPPGAILQEEAATTPLLPGAIVQVP